MHRHTHTHTHSDLCARIWHMPSLRSYLPIYRIVHYRTLYTRQHTHQKGEPRAVLAFVFVFVLGYSNCHSLSLEILCMTTRSYRRCLDECGMGICTVDVLTDRANAVQTDPKSTWLNLTKPKSSRVENLSPRPHRKGRVPFWDAHMFAPHTSSTLCSTMAKRVCKSGQRMKFLQ